MITSAGLKEERPGRGAAKVVDGRGVTIAIWKTRFLEFWLVPFPFFSLFLRVANYDDRGCKTLPTRWYRVYVCPVNRCLSPRASVCPTSLSTLPCV